MANLKDIFTKNQYDLGAAAKQSKTWFQRQARLLGQQRATPNAMLKSDPSAMRASIRPGNLYMFLYDAKTKDTLPFWDRFPLVFPFKKTANGFIGLNMHYLPYQGRIQLLDRLMDFANNKRMDETTRLNYSWRLINGVSKFRLAQPCVKQYLADHVRSSLRQVNSSDWATAMLLPVEQFTGAAKQSVWANSLRG